MLIFLISVYKRTVMSCLPLLPPYLPSGTDGTFQLVDQTIPPRLVCVRYFITVPRRVTNIVSILKKVEYFTEVIFFPRHHKNVISILCEIRRGQIWLSGLLQFSHRQGSALCQASSDLKLIISSLLPFCQQVTIMLMCNWLITSLETVRTLLINFTILLMHLLLIYSLKM